MLYRIVDRLILTLWIWEMFGRELMPSGRKKEHVRVSKEAQEEKERERIGVPARRKMTLQSFREVAWSQRKNAGKLRVKKFLFHNWLWEIFPVWICELLFPAIKWTINWIITCQGHSIRSKRLTSVIWSYLMMNIKEPETKHDCDLNIYRYIYFFMNCFLPLLTRV